MGPSSSLNITTAGKGEWLVTYDMRITSEGRLYAPEQRITVSLIVPSQASPSPSVEEVQRLVLQKAQEILQDVLQA